MRFDARSKSYARSRMRSICPSIVDIEPRHINHVGLSWYRCTHYDLIIAEALLFRLWFQAEQLTVTDSCYDNPARRDCNAFPVLR